MGSMSELVRVIDVGRVPWVAGDDPDVNTKSGRWTDIEVSTSNLRVFGDHVTIDLIYRVFEVSRDNTTLQHLESVTIFAPAGFRVSRVGEGRSHTTFRRTYGGRDHDWHDETAAVEGTYLRQLSFKFDGVGRDDQGNAQMRCIIAIPVELRPR